jgi:rubrerythrin
MDPIFESAVEGLDKMGASVSERKLVEMLTRHGEEESALLERYQRFAEEVASPAVRYLVNLIVEEESKHHRLLAEMANAVAWGWSGKSSETAIPEVFLKEDPPSSLRRETDELLAAEERDRSELRRLAGNLEPYEDTTLWGLVVELMLLDTEKHTVILRFISNHVS